MGVGESKDSQSKQDIPHRANTKKERSSPPVSICSREENDEAYNTPSSIPRPRRLSTQRLRTFRLPKKIILIRHGESLGNVNAGAYCHIPDWRVRETYYIAYMYFVREEERERKLK